MQMLDEAVQAASAAADGDERRRRLGAGAARRRTSTRTCPADYIPYEQAKVDVHRRIAGAREVAEIGLLREELIDRFGELPEPLENLLLLQTARIKLGQAGADRRVVHGRAAGGDADRARLAPGQGAAGGDPGGAVRVGQVAALDAGARPTPAQQFTAVVRAADALLSVMQAAEAEPAAV